MSLLESPIRVQADHGNGPEPMLMVGAIEGSTTDGGKPMVKYLLVDALGEIWELTKEWVNVEWRYQGGKWVYPEEVADNDEAGAD